MTLPTDYSIPDFLFDDSYKNVIFFPDKSIKDFCFDKSEFTPRHIRKMKKLLMEKVVSLDEWRDLTGDKTVRLLVCFPFDEI